jgi:hypothetical protein
MLQSTKISKSHQNRNLVPYLGMQKVFLILWHGWNFHGFFSILIFDLSLVVESWGGEGSTLLP